MNIANHSDQRFPLVLNIQHFAEEPSVPAIDSQLPVSSEPPASSSSVPNPNGDPTPPPQGNESPKGFNVKFLSEEKFIPESEATEWIQKGLNHDRLQDKLKGVETQAQMLDRVAKYYGFSNHEEFQKEFEQAERVKSAREQAKQLGMDEELYMKFLHPVNEKLSQYEKTIEGFTQKETTRQVETEISTLKSQYPDFVQHESKILDMAIEKGYSLKDAYVLVTHEQKLTEATQKAEQEALEKLKQNANSSPGSLGNSNPESFGYASMTPAEKKAFREKVKSGQH